MSVTLNPGERAEILPLATRAAGTYDSFPYWLRSGGGLIVIIEVTDATGGGTITDVSLQEQLDANFDTVKTFTAQAITTTSRNAYRIAAGSVDAGAWKGVSEGNAPSRGRIRIVLGTNPLKFRVVIEATR